MEKQTITTTGRRKTAIATARLVPGKGQVIVNGKPADQYFAGCIRLRGEIEAPLKLITEAGGYDFMVKAVGGGVAGQAGAIRHAISRALAGLDLEKRKVLKKAGYLTRDPRMVERKKPGQPKARKRFQFSKR